MSLQQSYLTRVREKNARCAVVFVHGFIGQQDDTWDRFPSLLGSELAGWDIYTLGYDTTFLPDVAGIWSADPDLPLVAKQYLTSLTMQPLDRYDELALVGHSMGGLVLQYALTRPTPAGQALRARAKRVVMFGTPSGGLAKAAWFAFWKRQLLNMAEGSAFIRELREAWSALGDVLPFEFLVVAGSKDQFVPPCSSLGPFAERFHRVVPGDHLQIVKPAGTDSESVRLLMSCLVASAGDVAEPGISALQLAAERPTQDAQRIVATTANLTSEADIVNAALALDRAGMRDESIALLRRHLHVGTDVQGTLGGRMKRLWLAQGDARYAARAAELYEGALARSLGAQETQQIYYHAINLAFLALAAKGDHQKAEQYGKLALQHALRSTEDLWSVATQAEAGLYLGDLDKAIELYKRLPAMADAGWKLLSAGQQAFHVARALGDRALADEIDAIFSVSGGKIFVSYSHHDKDWLQKFKLQISPYLQNVGAELEMWDDSRIQPGGRWASEIDRALQHCSVAVLLVSEHFLNSEFIMKRELPLLMERARKQEIQIFWFVLSPCGYDTTPLRDIQAAADPELPLSDMNASAQSRALLQVARTIKKAALERPTRTLAGDA